MNRSESSAIVTILEKQWEFYFENTAVLTLTVHYPCVEIPDARQAQSKINGRVEEQTRNFYSYASGPLYYRAVQEYKDSRAHDFPFRPYDAVLNYTVAYNENCYLSVYRDQYEFTGGAHGITVRRSDTWGLQTGRTLPMAYFFGFYKNFKRKAVGQILMQAEQNSEEDPEIYFKEYKTLIPQYFDPKSYYLMPNGIAVYFQQYEIAPYSSGIVTFVVPYKNQPSCS